MPFLPGDRTSSVARGGRNAGFKRGISLSDKKKGTGKTSRRGRVEGRRPGGGRVLFLSEKKNDPFKKITTVLGEEKWEMLREKEIKLLEGRAYARVL